MATGRQPSRLPFGFSAWSICLWAVAALGCAAPAKAEVPRQDIVVMAVDSSRIPDPAGPDARLPVHRPIREGVDEVARDINRRGGLLGRRLTIMPDNDQCDTDEAAAVAARAIALGAAVVIGHTCSSAAIRAATIYAEAGLVMIATGPRHPRLTSLTGRRGIHRLAGRDDRQAESIAALLATAFAGVRTAIIHDQSLQGRGMAEEIRRSAAAANAPVILTAPYISGKKDYAAVVDQIVAAKVDLAVFPGQPFEASIILDQTQSAGRRIATAIGTDVLAADAPPKRLLAATAEFLVMLPWPGLVLGLGSASGSGSVPAFAPHDAKLTTERLLAGAALEAWALAVGHARSLAHDSIVAALRRPSWATRAGAIHFDDKGDAVVRSFLPHVWRDGRWQLRR